MSAATKFETVWQQDGRRVGINVPNDRGQMLPVLDGRTGEPLNLAAELLRLRDKSLIQAHIERVAAGCGVAVDVRETRANAHQERYFRWSD